jgi:K+ transporter
MNHVTQPSPASSSSRAQIASEAAEAHGRHGGVFSLALGSVGVVFGDIGTSPLYALRESLVHVKGDGLTRPEVIGVVSLLFWALIIVVTLKYVVLIMRADNKGEGGTLSLMALAQTVVARGAGPVLFLGVAGAALFYGDSIITPAISVLSAVEGLKLVAPEFDAYILPIAVVILVGLFAVQSRGTGRVATFFGPIMAVWFLTLGGLGLMHISDDLSVLVALNPLHGLSFLIRHGVLGFVVMGSVFLAVTGAMLADTGLIFIVAWKLWKWNRWLVMLIVAPFLIIDIGFFSSNLFKFLDGGYLPLLFGAALVLVMWTWVRGTNIVMEKARRDSVPLADLARMLEKSKPTRVVGTAVFLTADPETAPGALLHNLKHNKVLHKRNIVLTIKTLRVPRIAEDEELTIHELSEDLKLIVVKVGYMQTPRVPHILAVARRRGLDFELMQTTFFLGRRTIKAAAHSGMPLWQDNLFIFLSRTAANATDFFQIPYGRVVELGNQITV